MTPFSVSYSSRGVPARRIAIHVLIALGLVLPWARPGFGANLPVQYLLDLRNPPSHLVRITMMVPEAVAGTKLQFPAWSNLYQIRDFVRDVEQVQAECNGRPRALKRLDLNTWQSEEACPELEVRYAVYANQDNVFSSALNSHHAFLNLALLLFYLPQSRQRPARLRFFLPEGWKLVTLLKDGPAPGEYQALNYDRLADCPAEAGTFQEYDYDQNGASYRVVVDGDSRLYSSQRLLAALKKITATETTLMRDVPFSRYTFIFLFPNATEGGGMEHRDGTAISVPAAQVRAGLGSIESMAAHEFFHLWNVKRIRPTGLEPIDYIHGNDTSDLWFSEGVTCTYAELVLLRSGLINCKEFYNHVAAQIAQLESRPARHFQSAEESGREAWLEKYADYFRKDRSISYYNKGELLGYWLDLAIRHASDNRYSLDDLMRRLDDEFARQGRPFGDQDLIRTISELAPSIDCRSFFRAYVDGTQDLDEETYLGYAGLRLVIRNAAAPDLGSESLKSFIGPVRVESVDPKSNAYAAGLRPGDVLLTMNGMDLPVEPSQELIWMHPGDLVSFTLRRGTRTFQIRYRLGSKTAAVYRVQEAAHPTREQLQVREGWLKGKTARDHKTVH